MSTDTDEKKAPVPADYDAASSLDEDNMKLAGMT